MNSNPVFVYGTLRKGASNHFRMAGAEFVSAGHVRGKIFQIDWYPGLRLGGENFVRGELYLVSDELLAALDIFEGVATEGRQDAEYQRVKTDVVMDDGKSKEAWVWEWMHDVTGAKPLPIADWLKYDPNPSN